MRALLSILEKVGLTESFALSSAINPLQIYRTHLATQLAPIVGTDPSTISPAIQRTLTSENGDLVLPIPALRIKEKKPDELAKLIQEKVH
jgi:arginyl-tRNA synthetase